MGRSCVDDLGGKLDALAAQKGLKQDFLKEDPAEVAPWADLMAQNSLFSLNAQVPALIIQGDADDIVRPQVTTQFVRASCRAGARIEYVTLTGKGHGGAMDAGHRRAVGLARGPARGPAGPQQLQVSSQRRRQ